MEVNQQSHRKIQQTKMRQQLGLIHWMENFLALEFDHDSTFYNKVCAKTTLHLYGFIYQRDSFLSFHSESEFFEFVRKADFVGGFEQAWTEPAVNFDRSADNGSRKVVGH